MGDVRAFYPNQLSQLSVATPAPKSGLNQLSLGHSHNSVVSDRVPDHLVFPGLQKADLSMKTLIFSTRLEIIIVNTQDSHG